jgi:hypothetical protein
MATRVQKQTAWTLWNKNLAETLEPYLAEIKQQGESKLQHPEPLARRKLLHPMLHWEKRRAAVPPDAGSKPAWETFGRPTDEHQAPCSISPATPRINQHRPLGRLTPPAKKKNWIINNELKTTHSRVGGIAQSALEKGGEARSWSPHKLSVNKGWKGKRTNSRPVISRCLK